MGTAGAVIATVIGNIAASGYYLWYVTKKSSLLSLHPRYLRSCKNLVTRTITLGLPSGASAALRGGDVFFILRTLAGYAGGAPGGNHPEEAGAAGAGAGV